MKIDKLFLMLTVILCVTTLVCCKSDNKIGGVNENGSCGDNLTWCFSKDTKTITISGTGEMDEFFRAPWHAFIEDIEHVIMLKGAQSIGNYAFYDLRNLVSITIPEGVTNIGKHAFEGCVKLKSIIIPEGVTAIRDETFKGCTSLTHVTIPNSVTSIGSRAFSECEVLFSIVFPDNLLSIGEGAFSRSGLISLMIPKSVNRLGRNVFFDCYNLREIIVDKENGFYDSRNDCNAIIETKSNELIEGCQGTVIPQGVTKIGDYAFDSCNDLVSVIIPESVISIGEGAFKNCYHLGHISIPNSVTTIEKRAFYRCLRLSHITLPNSITSIGGGAFGYTNITTITIPSNVIDIGYELFVGCDKLISIKVDKGNKVYDSRNDCNAIIITNTNELIAGCKETIIPTDITSIGNCAFEWCCTLSSLAIPDGVINIGNSTFAHCHKLSSLEIPNSVVQIGGSAFEGCYALTSVIIPGSVTGIGYSAFAGCSSLNSLDIQNGVTSIGGNAFGGCGNLTNISIPSSVIEIGPGAFYNTAWYKKQDDGLLYLDNWLVGTKGEVSAKDIEIQKGTIGIASGAIDGRNLVSITIPDGLANIGNNAFRGYGTLTVLNSYICDISKVNVDSTAFNIPASCIWHVVEKTTDIYREQKWWQKKWNIIDDI